MSAEADLYAAFIRETTSHLLPVRLRPFLGISRWVVGSTREAFGETMRPVVVWGSETRARKRAQVAHVAHARARRAVEQGLDADLAGTWRVRREYDLLWRDHHDKCLNAQQVGGRW
jgi:hypothetical protein